MGIASRPKLNRGYRGPIITLTHAARRVVRRIGSGIDPEELVKRCWEKKLRWPEHWVFPRKKGVVYLRYGDCVLVFGRSRDGGRVQCVTVFGPFREDGSWWENNIWKRR